jgi:hypothetical protein
LSLISDTIKYHSSQKLDLVSIIVLGINSSHSYKEDKSSISQIETFSYDNLYLSAVTEKAKLLEFNSSKALLAKTFLATKSSSVISVLCSLNSIFTTFQIAFLAFSIFSLFSSELFHFNGI